MQRTWMRSEVLSTGQSQGSRLQKLLFLGLPIPQPVRLIRVLFRPTNADMLASDRTPVTSVGRVLPNVVTFVLTKLFTIDPSPLCADLTTVESNLHSWEILK
jgi:hypothetical protein